MGIVIWLDDFFVSDFVGFYPLRCSDATQADLIYSSEACSSNPTCSYCFYVMNLAPPQVSSRTLLIK